MYNGNGSFREYLYETVAGSEVYVNGLKCKIIKLVADRDGAHSGLPSFAGSSDAYLCLGTDGEPKQLRIYNDHKMSIDFDWGHNHYNDPKRGGDGRHFTAGTVHVQSFGAEDRRRNTFFARYMSNDEIRKYGEIIHHFCPTIKLRP